MPLFKVTHRPVDGSCGYENTIVADDAAEAIALRNVALGLEDEVSTYDVIVDTVPDPDGSKARRWLEVFGWSLLA